MPAPIATGSAGVEFDPADESAVRADYEDGQARGVKGSPHYFVANDDFFCPALELGRDAEDHLTARFDPAGVGAGRRGV